MKRVHFSFSKSISRRSFLRGTGAAIALPWLDAMTPAFASSLASQTPRRFVSISLALGLHAPNLNPIEAGRNYTPSLYLSKIPDLLNDLTVVTGSSHPGVGGGHRAEGSILTGAPYSNNATFKNTISIDQYLAKHQGHHTRYPSLVLNIESNNSPSYTENGSMIPAEFSASRLFAKLFMADSKKAQRRQIERLKQGRSIMDIVAGDSKRLMRELGTGDKEKMDQYLSSVRDFEKRLGESEEWAGKAKPKVEMKPPVDIQDRAEVIRRKKLMLDIMQLALQTDSTRFITLHLNGEGATIPIEGVNEGYHGLSHHGLDEHKLEQLTIVETELIKTYGGFLRGLKQTQEASGSLLDNTSVLLTSNLGNASSHDNRNMPVLLAGGGFKHGQHIAFDQENNYPLPNLFMSILRRHGMDTKKFSTSTQEMSGLEMI
ncbi:DUF1552 domain-containing protein [Pelagicoccus mobilis]|uniref:DUF1552 domain-containing protein n=1 Tax=Pelagicoccus mobilis TaxID=415221 RepID=A0A934RXH4_9BACT|nr:DUF1552 domain-containing protein [Pelagicoccus mobilis]MBK1878128.1 DUF1552 domain-containing protein [Pelagicoccus mobilis]